MRLFDDDMKEAVKSFRRNAKERYDHLMEVAHQAWQMHSSILLIRLDWGFKRTYFQGPYRFMNQADFEACFAQVRVYREQMLSILKKMFGKNLAFYAWKIECGDKKGIHIHWLLGVNGSKHQDRINVGRAIQYKWDATIGDDQTYTFNVNALLNGKQAGLRVIDYHDPELWEIVGRYADYFLKVDYTVKLRMPEKVHCFGCSKLRKTMANKRGPKRKMSISPSLKGFSPKVRNRDEDKKRGAAL
jgi:hypothetical protein